MPRASEIVFFDLETGGLDEAVHPIIQFAGIAVGAGWEELETLEMKIQFDTISASAEALKVNGWTVEAWTDALSVSVALGRIADFFARHATMQKISAKGRPYSVAEVAAHNAPFDARFLGAWFKRWGKFLPAACFEALDTVDLSRWVSRGGPARNPSNRPANHKLGTLCDFYGIDNKKAHDALGDVRATVALARHLRGLCGLEIL